MEVEVHASRGGAREVHRFACFSHKKTFTHLVVVRACLKYSAKWATGLSKRLVLTKETGQVKAKMFISLVTLTEYSFLKCQQLAPEIWSDI